MSIFKNTIDPTIASQLKARESVVSTSGSRDANFLRYTTGKNSWVRMTSFVNYKDSSDLSKKYILEGGTLYTENGDDGKTKSGLRSGVGKGFGAYASNLDMNTVFQKEPIRPFGIRPMPGIAQASVVNKSAYGSLREATIEFYAWDKHQLEELELLFMRPGYTVFLEWGWSEYIDHNVSTVNKIPEIKGIKNFDIITLDPFQQGLTDKTIYKKIDDDIKSSKGNYDAMLGYIKNFSWQLLPNGGFQCTTVLISRGEILETLKTSTTTNFSFNSANNQTPEQVMATMFEKILLTIIGSINDAAYSSTFYTTGLPAAIPGELYNNQVVAPNPQATTQQLTQIQKDLRAKADAEFNKINDEIKKQYSDIDLNKETFVKYCDGKDEGTAIEYISMDAFIALLNTFLIPKSNSTTNIVEILIPRNTPCLASEDSVSIDPTTCLIKNSKAKFIADNTTGFDPYVENIVSISNTSPGTKQELNEFLGQGSSNLGSIGNIYISINKILTLFRNVSSNKDGLTNIILLQKVLDDVSFALGGINDFQIHSKKSEAQIIDVHYLEGGGVKDKYQFSLIGLNSICRDVKINSRIFAEQSTMIGIGAAAGGVNNLGDIYTSTQQQFNKGLTDRILNNITYQPFAKLNNLSPQQAYYYSIFKTLEGLKKYVTDKVLGVSNGPANTQYTIVPTSSEIANAGNALKTIHYQLNGKDVDFKALIPFELEITLDGIGGFIIGQIFTIDKSILPSDYYNKNLGFIITGINHKLQNNDWTTELKTQICLLDTKDELRAIGVKQNAIKKIINNLSKLAQQNTYLVSALADYLTFITFRFILLDDLQSIPTLVKPEDVLNPINTTAFITGSPTSKPQNDNIIANIVRARKLSDTLLDEFLQSWYSIASTKQLPGFPSDYNKFLSQTNNNSVAAPYDLNVFKEFILPTSVLNQLTQQIPHIGSWDASAYNDYKKIWDNSYLAKVTNSKSLSYVSKVQPIKEDLDTYNDNGKAFSDESLRQFQLIFPPLKTSGYSSGFVKAQGFVYSSKITAEDDPVLNRGLPYMIGKYKNWPNKTYNSTLTLSLSPIFVDFIETKYIIPSKNGDALDTMRENFYDYMDANNSSLGLSIYLSATSPNKDIVYIK